MDTRHTPAPKGFLVLEDGTAFQGDLFGENRAATGEVVFNTGMTGYQEVLTDPSYCGQIVVMTYPLVGNYGINAEDVESRKVQVRGFIVKELCADPSHWQSNQTLSAYLAQYSLTGLASIDTRALTRHLRVRGVMRGLIVAADAQAPDEARRDLGASGGWLRDGHTAKVELSGSLSEWLNQIEAQAKAVVITNQVAQVTSPRPYALIGRGGGPHVVVMDFGAKQNILRMLGQMGCYLTVVPATFSTQQILDLKPDGILLSNGPGDPKDLAGPIQTIRELARTNIPICGVCLGHQLLALAFGADTYKLKFGHRGSNQPVKDLVRNRAYITTQNHGYAVREDSLPAEMKVTHRNLNDGTIEGLAHVSRPIFCVQYHPEAAPGPEDSRYLFEDFLKLLQPATS